MKVELWDIAKLKPYPNNPRKIPQSAVDKVAASIKEFGFRQPIVVEPAPRLGIILVGHTRRLAALKLGMKKVPVHVAVGITPEQAKAYRLADNRTGEEAIWSDLLKVELDELKAMSVDLALTAFDVHELKELCAAQSESGSTTQTYEIPERFQILVNCKHESEQTHLLASLNRKGYDCRALIS